MVKNVVRSVCAGCFWKDSLFVSGRLVCVAKRSLLLSGVFFESTVTVLFISFHIRNCFPR
jgi:hypothetical protein